MAKKSTFIKLLPVLFGFFVMGFCDIVGFSSDYAQEAFGWSNTMTGFIPSMVFVWFLFLGIPIGTKMNQWGRKNTVMISMVITVLGMIIPLVNYNGVTTMIAYALLGIGNAILQVSLNPLLSNVVPDQKFLTSSLTAGQVVKAISSLLGPQIVLLAVNKFGNGDNELWYYSFPILGAITLFSAIWLLLTPIPKEVVADDEHTTSFKDTFALLKDKKILILFFGIFFVVGVDVATNFISSKLMTTRFGWEKSDASIAPQIYFFSRTVGALLGAFLMTKISEMRYFKINILLAIVVGLVLAFVEVEMVNLVAIGAIGFLASCIFPIIYSMAVQARPKKANQISGLMITAVAGGGAVTPLIGAATDAIGIIGGVFVILACILYLTYCAFGVKVENA
ncbi:sugar MFS transporter [Saccharicrinis sp. FJH62]|uniref:MFS transporter n=1 Tax=Saccharicrinis sp. FJH62 TaxID=3344657 RepID=UPI0035D43FC8